MSEAPDTRGSGRRVTLEGLQKFAHALRALRWFCLLGLLAAVGVFFAGVLELSSDADRYIIPAVLAGMWSTLLFAFINGFQEVPPPSTERASAIDRMRSQIVRGGYWLLAGVTGLASLGVLFMTYRLLTIWGADSG